MKETLFKVLTKVTDPVSVSLLPTLNKTRKTRQRKVKSIEDKEIIMAITMTKTRIKIIIIIMMIMRIKISNQRKMLKC